MPHRSNPNSRALCLIEDEVNTSTPNIPTPNFQDESLAVGTLGSWELSAEVSHAPRLIILHGLQQFLARVHDERSIARHRLVDRLSGHHEQIGRLSRLDRQAIA